MYKHLDPKDFKPYVREPNDDDIHGFFGLTYATHLVLPRVLLQSMPGWWQAPFVVLMEKYYEAVADVEQPAHYDVTAATQHEACDLTDEQRKLAGVTREWVDANGEEAKDDDEDGEWKYYDKDANEIEYDHRVLVPCADPLPHYNRGRTIVPLSPITPDPDTAQAEVERLNGELAKYVGWEPTVKQEYEHACGQIERVTEIVREFNAVRGLSEDSLTLASKTDAFLAYLKNALEI